MQAASQSRSAKEHLLDEEKGVEPEQDDRFFRRILKVEA